MAGIGSALNGVRQFGKAETQDFLAFFERILRPQITAPSRTAAMNPAISLFLVFSLFALSVWAGSRTGPGGWVCTGTSAGEACATVTVTAAGRTGSANANAGEAVNSTAPSIP